MPNKINKEVSCMDDFDQNSITTDTKSNTLAVGRQIGRSLE